VHSVLIKFILFPCLCSLSIFWIVTPHTYDTNDGKADTHIRRVYKTKKTYSFAEESIPLISEMDLDVPSWSQLVRANG